MSEPRRILILVTSLDRGGVETMIMNYYRKLDRKKWQFDFLVNREEVGSYEKEIREMGGKIFRMGGMYPWRYFRYQRELVGFLKGHPEYQIIHSHLEERSYWPLRIAKQLGVPVRMCHAHNVYPFSALNGKSYYREWFRKRLRVGGIVTERFACSAHAGKWLYGERAKFQIVTNAIDFGKLAYSAPGRKRLRRELGIAEEVKVAGFVGRLVAQKNPEFAIRVFAGLPNREEWVLVVLGKGAKKQRLQKLARELGVGDSVIFCGEVREVRDYYSAFDVLLMPSMYEGLGMVAVEAGASGLPVVASDQVPKEADVVKNTKFLPLTESLWVDELGEAVTQGKKAGRIVKMTAKMREYDITDAVERLERIYEDSAY